jgi:hypothetical protein
LISTTSRLLRKNFGSILLLLSLNSVASCTAGSSERERESEYGTEEDE